jgi:cell division initiation protein
MDVTPQVLHEVEFRAKVRGYDPDEVDDFLERVAVGVGQLQDRLRDAGEKAAAAESRVAELQAKLKATPPATDTDETLRRTLVLAQRTADAAIREANEEAARTLEEANDRATTVIAEAEARAGAIVKDAEDEVRKGVDATRQRLVSEIIDLEVTRDSVRADIGALERHLDEQRLRLRGAVADLQRLLDDPAGLRGLPAPLLTEARLPARFAEELTAVEAAPVPEEKPAVADVVVESPVDADDEAEAASETDTDAVLDDEPHDDADDGDSIDPLGAPSVRDDDDEWSVSGKGRIGLFDDLDLEDASPGFEFDEPGQHTEPVAHIPEGPEGDDAYLAELRKAMLTTNSDDDDDLPPVASPEPDQAPKFRSRFGRRR